VRLRPQFPSFSRRGDRAAAGVVSKRSRSLLILVETTNHHYFVPATSPPLKPKTQKSIVGAVYDRAYFVEFYENARS
jgi:hypothetical protein